MKKSFIDRYFWQGLVAIVVVGALANLYVWTRPVGGGAESVQATTVSAETLSLGADLYSATCATCHGTQGAGQGNVPALNGSQHAWHHSDEQLISQIRQGGMGMPAVGADWSDEEVDAVVSYIKAWWTPQQRDAQAGTLGE